MRFFLAVGLILLFTSAWLYSAYADYNVRDEYRMRVNLIPHDITRMAAERKELIDTQARLTTAVQRLTASVQRYVTRNQRFERCTHLQGGLLLLLRNTPAEVAQGQRMLRVLRRF